MTASVEDRYYSVFVSATYLDLVQERHEVISVLLKHGQAIPIGMEQFSAGSRPPWEVIKAAIDRCDYYLLIMKNRYGSLVPADLQSELGAISYTEAEYDYAQHLGLPTLVFVHADPSSTPASMSASSRTEQIALAKFRAKAAANVTLDRYTTPADLAAVVALAWSNLLRTQPARGWMRGTDPSAEPPSPVSAEIDETLDQWRTHRQRRLTVRVRFAARAKDLANLDGSDVETDDGLSTTVTLTWGEAFEMVAAELGRQRVEQSMATYGFSNHIGDHVEDYIDSTFLEALRESESRLRHRAAVLKFGSTTPSSSELTAIRISRYCYTTEDDERIAEGLERFGLMFQDGGLWELSPAGRRLYETERYSLHDDD